ncbi:uncharacterized protein LOC132795639 [Drosophila nasuta]|uniref:Uncharacterized protein LOC117578134 n=1 Tax=Drosophila albomicans TaxID=7291 RepID=A0A6P8XRE4_DROAB|nr:uncharacterized protein LOC117578134 [Drosophila albomicans]XP_060662479.1 uncharacterized protein LOC132795639 [Drosophila nasuta]
MQQIMNSEMNLPVIYTMSVIVLLLLIHTIFSWRQLRQMQNNWSLMEAFCRLEPGTVCSICIESITEGDTILADLQRLACDHWFHKICLRAWLIRASNCPNCRRHIDLPKELPELFPADFDLDAGSDNDNDDLDF